MTLPHPKTETILHRFTELSAIPRPSGREQAVLDWLKSWADNHHFPHRSDAAGNIVIDVPATPGRGDRLLLALQAHVDMVCEKIPGSPHDFTRDPIKVVRAGDWLRAEGTTLGADNGAAVALIMTLAEDTETPHPPLELLFTIEEETGLKGALKLDPALLRSRRLINLDSEEVGIFTIGCAGGRTTTATLPLTRVAATDSTSLRLSVGGLIGGHSGVDIHLGRANAIRLLAETLLAIAGTHDVHLQAFDGGSASNAIPRNAEAIIAVAPAFTADIAEIVKNKLADFKHRWNEVDPGLTIALEPAEGNHPNPIPPERGGALLRLLLSLPHGPVRMVDSQPHIVETSSNLARVATTEATLEIVVSERSSIMAELDALVLRVGNILTDHAAEVLHAEGYPAWQPDPHSPLLAQAQQVFRDRFKADAKVDIIHAGLECGVLAAKIPGLDMLSYGPTIKDPHSPSERLYIPSLATTWDFTTALLRAL